MKIFKKGKKFYAGVDLFGNEMEILGVVLHTYIQGNCGSLCLRR
ncbi:hypothetical protein R80B4_00864 [Fibrobacteres bacterium R8-0-B4]